MDDKNDSKFDARVRAWVSEQLTELKARDKRYTIAKVAEIIGSKREALIRIKTSNQGIPYEAVVKLAQLSKSAPPSLLTLETKHPVSKVYQLRESVAAQSWLEEEKIMAVPAQLSAKVLPDEAYSELTHIARHVDDSHADLFVPKGFYILTVPYFDARPTLHHNDYVVIERSRTDTSVPRKKYKELTIRQLKKNGKNWILKSCSSVPELAADIDYSGDTDDLQILELILNCYR